MDATHESDHRAVGKSRARSHARGLGGDKDGATNAAQLARLLQRGHGSPTASGFVEALARFEQDLSESSRRDAIDLGCGDGTESLALLQAGWRVLAIDREPAALDLLRSKVAPEQHAQLEIRLAPFEHLALPSADFIYAGYSLPFCDPAHFDRLWSVIVASLRPGGRFAGQLFGIHDSWTTMSDMNFHTEEQVQRLLQQAFVVEFFRVTDEDGPSFRGPKHWHIFDIVARKM